MNAGVGLDIRYQIYKFVYKKFFIDGIFFKGTFSELLEGIEDNVCYTLEFDYTLTQFKQMMYIEYTVFGVKEHLGVPFNDFLKLTPTETYEMVTTSKLITNIKTSIAGNIGDIDKKGSKR